MHLANQERDCRTMKNENWKMRYGKWFWCPRKDSNLQPLVCRTSAPSVELLGQFSSFEFRRPMPTNLELWTLEHPKRRTLVLEPLTGLEPALINVRSVAPFHLGYRGKLGATGGI